MSGRATGRFDPAILEILWSRLNGIADEMWITIRRTSFSSIVSAALDYGCAILDADGGQLVHPAGSPPGFNLALPSVTRELIRRYGGQIHPGDVFIGNDPWLCAGHLPDVAIITPVFHNGGLAAFSTSVAHQADFGGAHQHSRVREVYEEGLFLPVMKLYERGARNETLFQIIAANVRVPELVLGDIEAQVAANEIGARRLVKLMQEYDIPDPAELAFELQSRSERAMRAIIRDLPDGTYRADGHADSGNRPTKIAVAVTVAGDEILVDYAGTGDQLETGGVNCTLTYTVADAHYAIKAILAPHVPHNEGSTRPIKVVAPEGSILNCTFPAAVSARTRTGHHIYAVLFLALSQLAPDKVMAGPGLMQSLRVVGSYPDGRSYNAPIFAGGGQGGSMGRDGIGGYLFPIACAGISVELFEVSCPALITRREWVADSAGAGRYRGGPADRITMRRLPDYSPPVRLRYTSYRSAVPAPGMFGGADGGLDIPLWNGQVIPPDSEIRRDGWATFRGEADELTFDVPSGAGYGDPRERSRSAIEADLRSGIISREGALRDYGYPGPDRPASLASGSSG